MNKKHDWDEIQNYMNDGHTYRETQKKFCISSSLIYKARKSGKLKTKNKSEAMKLSNKRFPRTLSDDTKQKISSKRKQYLKENPDKIPYILNHSSKGMSYPEKYFKEVFENENMNLVYNYPVSSYWLDFADIENKIDIEIDGGQHIDDPKIVEHDKKRNKFLEDEGWKVIRIIWRDYKKLSKKEKREVVIKLARIVNKNIDEKISIKKYVKEKVFCMDCGKELEWKSKRCRCCQGKQNRKFQISKEELEKLMLIDKITFVELGKMFGVSGNAIRKRAKKLGIEIRKIYKK